MTPIPDPMLQSRKTKVNFRVKTVSLSENGGKMNAVALSSVDLNPRCGLKVNCKLSNVVI